MDKTQFEFRRKTYLLGCTEITKEVIESLREMIAFESIIEFKKNYSSSKYCGLPVCIYEEAIDSFQGLIVDCTHRYYEDGISEEILIKDGYQPYIDFIDYAFYLAVVQGKKVIITSGFCHVDDIYRGMIRLKPLSSLFSIYNFSYDVKRGEKYSNRILNRLKNICDIYIYNCNSNNTLNLCKDDLPDGCKLISIPLIRFFGIWPQININHTLYENEFYIPVSGFPDGAFIGGDIEINKRIHSGLECAQIKSILLSPSFYSYDFLKSYLEKSFRHMEYSERESMIKISDFIRENYQRKRLFKDFRHIDTPIVKEYIRQILTLLNLDMFEEDIDSIDHIEDIHEYTEMPVYPSVALQLQLEWVNKDTLYCVRSWNGSQYVTFEEFIEWYYAYSTSAYSLKKYW